MPHRFKTSSSKTVQEPVPYLRLFDWVSPAFTSFRERPLPSNYSPEVVPTFDIFGSSALDEVQFETVAGGLGVTEAFLEKVPPGKFRHYLSVAFFHNDPALPAMQLIRVVAADGAFPSVAITDNVSDGSARINEWYTSRNVIGPPESFIGARSTALALGARLTLRAHFVEHFLGESHSPV